MGYLLFLLATVLMWSLLPIAVVYNLFRSAFHGGDRMQQVAILIDQAGNVIFGSLFNDIFITKDGYKFGDRRETVSRVLGINKRHKTLSKAGQLLADILNWIDENHVEKAAD